MRISSDYRDLLKILNAHKVRYLIVGAYAVTYYTEPRFTKDLDIWVEPTPSNALKVFRALKEFGAPLKGIKVEDFMNKKLIYQIGVAPVRVDMLTSISGVNFTSAYKTRTRSVFEGTRVNIIGAKKLLKSKVKAGRTIDERDIAALKQQTKKRKDKAF